MTRLLLIDGNNLLWRNAYMHQTLTYNGVPVGAMYGVFKSLLKLKRDFPLCITVIVWDGGHSRRDELSQEGVRIGIIPEAYKENRTREPIDEQTKLVRWQVEQQYASLREGLGFTTAFQVIKKGYEADDLIATYALTTNSTCTIVTSDKDFYQLLEVGVVMFDPIKEAMFSLERFRAEFGLEDSQQWVDVGALAGDAGDNIFGVPGVGEKTAVKLIAEHKTLDRLLVYLHEQNAQNLLTSKKLQAILANEARVRLAYRLKQMDYTVPNLPDIMHLPGDGRKLAAFFEAYGFDSLTGAVSRFV